MSQREKCPFGVILVLMQGNAYQNNSESGHFLRSVIVREN